LLELPEYLKDALVEGKLKLGHVQLASQLPSPEECEYAMQMAIRFSWTVSVMERYVKSRLAELELKKRLTEEVKPPALPPPEKAEEMARISNCTACTRAVEVSRMRYPPLCDDCYALLKYALEFELNPRECAKLLYEAMTHFKEFKAWQEKRKEFEEYIKMKREAGSEPARPETPSKEHGAS